MIVPLRKRTLTGDLYVRDERVETRLSELERLPGEELLTRCIHPVGHPDRVEDECVLHFVRAMSGASANPRFEQLYRNLAMRALRLLPKAERADGTTTDRTKERVREIAFDRFTEMLVADRNAYDLRLDFFEVRFAAAMANLRRDAFDRVWREEKRTTHLEFEDGGELAVEVAIPCDPFEASDDADYRIRVDEAIDGLPEHQRRIVEMLRLELPISSSDPEALTIAKALGRSEKTIRTHRDKAFAAIRACLAAGGYP